MSVEINHAQRPRANDYAWCYSRTNVLIRLHKPTLWWHVYMLNTPNESWPGLYIGYGYNLLSYAYHYDISPSSLLLMLHTMLEKYSNFQISRNFNLSLSLLCHTQHTSSIHPYHYHLQAVLGWSMCRILPFHPYLLWTILTNMFSPVHNSALCLSNESCLYNVTPWKEAQTDPYIYTWVYYLSWWIEWCIAYHRLCLVYNRRLGDNMKSH
jgi:hypothetical protein